MDDKKFKYTYSAPTAEEKKEILKIQNEYLPKEQESVDSKVIELKKLDKAVKRPAAAVSIIIGVIGFILFSLGMTMSTEWKMVLWGAIAGIVGLVLMAFAYPIRNKIVAIRKKKYAEQILKLSQDLLGEDKGDNVSFDIKDSH